MKYDDEIKNFVNTKNQDCDLFLFELRKFAEKNNIPIVSSEVAGFLSLILDLIRPKKILELGCAIGYSSILMSKFLDKNGIIFTIEISEKMIDLAKRNFDTAKINCVKLIKGDAKNVLPGLILNGHKFDFIFIDCAKGQYINILPFCLDLLNLSGMIIADDIFQNGNILKKRLEIPRRQRTIYTRMNNFIDNIFGNKKLESKIFNIGDGVIISKKIL